MRDLEAELRVLLARRMDAEDVTRGRRRQRLVQGDPILDAIAERPPHQRGILTEGFRRGALAPAAAIIERLRQIPMVERDERSDVLRQQRVDQLAVEVEPALIAGAAAGWNDARPGDREAIRIEAE